MSATNAEGQAETAPARVGTDPVRIGRRIGIAVYLLVLGYVVVLGFGTFIRGTFYPPMDAFVGTPDCPVERVRLARELRALTNRALADEGATNTDSFFDAWDRRYEGLRSHCSGDPEFRNLETLRYRVEIQLDRFDRDTARTFRRVLDDAARTENPP